MKPAWSKLLLGSWSSQVEDIEALPPSTVLSTPAKQKEPPALQAQAGAPRGGDPSTNTCSSAPCIKNITATRGPGGSWIPCMAQTSPPSPFHSPRTPTQGTQNAFSVKELSQSSRQHPTGSGPEPEAQQGLWLPAPLLFAVLLPPGSGPLEKAHEHPALICYC